MVRILNINRPVLLRISFLIAWILINFILSTDIGSPAHSEYFAKTLYACLGPLAKFSSFEHFHLFLRKLAHITEYGILMLLVVNTLSVPVFKIKLSALKTRYALALSICTCLAFSDEFHQSFVPSRTASLTDVAIDITGSLLGLIIFRLYTPS